MFFKKNIEKTIDWETIWAIHSPRFKNKLAHIDLPNREEVLLKPGPGFGDYSHPTTQLVMELMMPYVRDKITLDIGCGSGILSIAAYKLGASSVYGCDICNEAVSHAQENLAINNIKKNVYLYPAAALNSSIPGTTSIILMNMISSEQKQAWPFYMRPFHTLISSGILFSEKTSYLEMCSSWGWKPIEIKEKDGWMGFIFNQN